MSLTLWELCEQHMQDIQDAYEQLAGKTEEGKMDMEISHNFVEEISQIIQRDCTEAKIAFNEETYESEPAIEFDKFLHLFKAWAEYKQDELNGQHDDQDQFQEQNPYPISQEDEDQLQKSAQQFQQDQPIVGTQNVYKQHNRMLVERFLKYHDSAIEAYFADFSKETEGKPLVSATEIPLVLRVSFYIDNITFHLSKEDPEEYFNKQDSYKSIMASILSFIETNKLQQEPDINNFKFSYPQYLQFLDFFINNEPTLFLRQGYDYEYEDENQPKKMDNSETDLEKEIKTNIQKYEQMLDKAQTDKERIVINNMLSALYDQFHRIQQIKSPSRPDRKAKKKMTKQELRKRNLLEIFDFYCKQQYVQSVVYSFDRIMHESNVMNLSNFLFFCKQFKITNYNLKLQKKQLPILFKKNAGNYKELSFEEFQQMCEKIALYMFEDKDEEMPTDMDKVEGFYKYIGVDNPNFFRKHMHLLNPPFNIQDKEGFRLLPRDQGRPLEMKKLEPKLKQELERRKKEREFLLKKYISMTPAPVTQDKRKLGPSQSLANISNISNIDQLKKHQSNHYIFDTYQQKHQKVQTKKLDQQNKVTWEQLENLEYGDIKQPQQGKFKPTDLFDEYDDHEDRQYLAQYSLQNDKIKKQQQMYQNKLYQESYGQYRQNMRPTEKIMLKNDPSYVQKGYQGSNVHRYHALEDSFEMNPSHLNPSTMAPQPQQYKNYNSYSTKNINSQIGQNIMNRASQVDQSQRLKEQNMINSIAAKQQAQYQRGIQALKKQI